MCVLLGLDHKAGVITLLLDERLTLAFALTTASEWARTSIGESILEVVVKGLHRGKSDAGIGACQSEVAETGLLQDSHLLLLEGGNLGAEGLDTYIMAPVTLNLCSEPPVSKMADLLDQVGISWRVGTDEVRKPLGKCGGDVVGGDDRLNV
jgi:hypothetical protein